MGASNKQVITIIWSDTDKENLLVKSKNIYNKYVTQKQKYLSLFMPIQAFIVKFYKKNNWYISYIEDDED